METALPQAGPLPSPAEANLHLNTTPRGPGLTLRPCEMQTGLGQPDSAEGKVREENETHQSESAF